MTLPAGPAIFSDVAPGALPGSIGVSGGAGDRSPLGILTTKFVSAPELPEAAVNFGKLSEARIRNRARRWMEQIATGNPRTVRFAQLAFLRERLPGEREFRTKFCLSHLQFDKDYLSLLYSDKQSKARFYGAAVCGSVWTCPVCAERITAVRRSELKKLLSLTKYRVVMVTFTLEHHEGEALKPMVDSLNRAVRAMKKHRAWRRFSKKWGLVGHVHALEVTRGKNGWHPHRHEMLVLDPEKLPKDGSEAKALLETEMRRELYEMYHFELNEAGRDCDEEHGVAVSANRKDYGDYISKWGVTEELTRSTNKLASNGGKSVWELLTDAVNGDASAWADFLEYARAFKGKKQLHWSKGLRELLELPLKELSDEEAANTLPEPEERTVVQLSRSGLYFLRDNDLYPSVLTFTEKVKGDVQEVIDFLARMGLRRFVLGGHDPRSPVGDKTG